MTDFDSTSGPDFQLTRLASGRLQFTGADCQPHEGVTPVRAFPLAAPDEGISLVSTDGHELAWIARLAALPKAVRALVQEELALRDFVPQIRRLGHGALLIAGSEGVQYSIADMAALDRGSRRLLERFL